MAIQQVMLGLGGPFRVDSAQFDGSNDRLDRGGNMTGLVDGKSGILSVWLRVDGGNGSQTNVQYSTLGVGAGITLRGEVLIKNSSNVAEIIATNSSGVVILDLTTSTSFAASSTWRHVLASWNLATGVSHLYINDVSDQNVITRTNDTINYATGDHYVGSTGIAVQLFNGCIAELWWYPNQFLDFSVTANRRKFITAAGKPEFLGINGSRPLGTAPISYLHLNKGEDANNFAINRGTGGNYSVTGSLTTGSSSPTD